VQPPIDFLYYEVEENDTKIAVIEVKPTRSAFHVVSRDLGKLREGQIVIRQGSTTRGITTADLHHLYMTPGYGYADQLIDRAGLAIAQQQIRLAHVQQLENHSNNLIRQVETTVGLPPGSLGSVPA
jgi:hypothetical protein